MKTDQRGFSAVEGVLVVAVVGLISFVGWYIYSANNSADKTYTAANKSAQSTAKFSKSKNTHKQALTPEQKQAEAALIVAAVKAYTVAGVSQQNATINADTIEIVGNNARGTVGFGDGGSQFIAHKSNGKWIVVSQGQMLPGKAQGIKYSLPASWYSLDY